MRSRCYSWMVFVPFGLFGQAGCFAERATAQYARAPLPSDPVVRVLLVLSLIGSRGER